MLVDALIIGAGPAGATTALLLAQAGWSVGIVEKQCFPRRKVCGEFISATSLPLLKKLGIADLYLHASGPEVTKVGLLTATTSLTANMPAANHTLAKWGRAFKREYLDKALLDRAVTYGVKVWQPAHIENLQRKAGLFSGMVTSQQHTEAISARLVIMAQGSWQPSSLSAKVHQSADLLAFKAHFSNSSLPSDLMPLLLFPGGYGGLVHSGQGLVTLSCCIRRDMLKNARQQQPGLAAGEVVLQHIATTCVGVAHFLKHAQREGKWLAAGPIQPGIRQRYANGIFFVGNSAGEAHPIIAEGISMALQSAWLLAQILSHQRHHINDQTTLSALGKQYSKRWRQQFAPRIHAAKLFTQLANRPWIIATLLPLLKQFPGILTFGAKLSGKIQPAVIVE